jgi:hypothetical protein
MLFMLHGDLNVKPLWPIVEHADDGDNCQCQLKIKWLGWLMFARLDEA